MKISKNKVVTIIYELRFDNGTGEIIEKVKKDQPISFIYGVGDYLEVFEANIKDMEKGSKFEFALTTDQAYGEVDENAVIELPKAVFEIDGKIEEGLLEEGNYIPMQTEDGEAIDGVVLEVGDEFVLVDFNHPLAGENLYFKGEIIDVREATKDEIENGLE